MRLLIICLFLLPLQLFGTPKKSKAQLATEAERSALKDIQTQEQNNRELERLGFDIPKKTEVKRFQLKLSAKKVESAKNLSTDWSLSNGSSDTTSIQNSTVEIEILNLGPEQATPIIDVFFMSDDRIICDWYSKNLSIAPKETMKFLVQSKPVKRHDVNYNALNIHEASGKTLESWIARLKQGNDILVIRASTKPLEIFAKDSAVLNKLCARWKMENNIDGWQTEIFETKK